MAKVLTRVDLLQVLEEAAAIYVYLDLDEPVSSETLDEWKDQIETVAKSVMAEEFGLDAEQIELEVELLEGSLWAKVKPKLQTIALILSLYNGVHNAAERLPQDYEMVSEKIAVAAEQITHGTVKSIEGVWNNAELLYEMIERGNPLSRQNGPPEDE